MEDGLHSSKKGSQARGTGGRGVVRSWAWEQHPASAHLLLALLKPPSRPALFYKRSPHAWGSPLRGFIACMTLLPAMSQAFYWVRWLGEECLNCGWSGSRRLERGWGGCWTPFLGDVFWSLAGKPLLCWDEPLLPAGRLWLPGCGKGGIGPSFWTRQGLASRSQG